MHAIASTTTRKGRSMIEETKNYVEANFPGAKCDTEVRVIIIIIVRLKLTFFQIPIQ